MRGTGSLTIGLIFPFMSADGNILLEHQIYFPHKEKESVGLSNEWSEFVFEIKLSCSFFGIHNNGPGGHIF